MPAPEEDEILTPPSPEGLGGERLSALARPGLAAAAAVAVAGALLSLATSGDAAGARPWGAAALLAWAGAALLAVRVSAERLGRVLAPLLAAGTLAVAVAAALSGRGAESPVLGLLTLLALAAGALTPWRVATLLGLLMAAAIGVLAAGGVALGSLAPSMAALGALPAVAGVGAGVALGVLGARLLSREAAKTAQELVRFQQLLSIAGDAHWELDTRNRLTHLSRFRRGSGRPLPVDIELLGREPWTLPQLALAPEALDQLLADLESRSAFRDLPVRWIDDEDRERHLLVSGEPQLDGRGAFVGFWGVARDVSAVSAARQALLATEYRFQDLFDHLPTALLLHRDGVILEANPAALALFGHEEPEGLEGTQVLDLFSPGDSRERARRQNAELQQQALGAPEPVADFLMQDAAGKALRVRATGVRVDAGDGPATLSIIVDETERRLVEEAVHRSEALLSQLVAGSPDVIAVVEWPSGRLVMTNRAFERVLGWTAEQVHGRSAAEVGLWPVAGHRELLWEALQRAEPVREMAMEFGRRDGGLVAMRLAAARFSMDRSEFVVLTARDVSAVERHRMEREAILETASIGIGLTREGRVVLANPKLARLLGWPPGTLSGQPWQQFFGSPSEADAVVAQAAPGLARGESVQLERALRRRDGSTFTALITASAVDASRPVHAGTVWIIEDVTKQREAEKALAAARDSAEAANLAKSAFLANTSHELRTPLHGIIGLARLAREPALDKTRRHAYLDQISDSAQSLAAIINDILDLSRIESGGLEVDRAPFDLGGLVRTLQVGYTVLASAHGLQLKVQVDPAAQGRVLGDAMRLRQILSHYLSNALKFTPAGEVRLSVARRDERTLRFEVQDSGPGIDRAAQQRLFQPFSLGDDSPTRVVGGPGLGLALCRRLAELMGGHVGVDSAPGQGSRFWAELPLPEAPPEEGLPAPVADLGGARVLLVEDNAVNMLIGVALLEKWGVSVEQARDGHEAVDTVARAHAEGRPFDAVLMDVQMPRMSGYEATRLLRQRYGEDVLPILALTAAGFDDERDHALAAGMNDFLPKPIDADRLREALARWVGWRAALKA